ncbi:hypothetical protein Sinac_2037 [Singulisphaera acidiphila DSM 18658]|uniref:Uncharacterized protein n=2 Tax=Singulisphaera acidiphila TaxID=466153 RepID=L0DAY4_SINAD|nr:hypothetical protein Sinac_2037 [Singulisphaera acidiphila DSM 18658]
MERTVTVRTELESILVEQALAMARELEAVTDAAPDGQVLAVGELTAVRLGRELTRVALESALQQQAQAAEKKGLPAEPAPAAAVARSRTRRPRRP